MLLYELLLFIAAGTLAFIVSEIATWVETQFPAKEKPVRRKRKREIKADLDVLYHQYRQGVLGEAEYLDLTDHLIDQLAELSRENARVGDAAFNVGKPAKSLTSP